MPRASLTGNGVLVLVDVAGVPVWVIVVTLTLSGAAIAMAMWGRPMKSHPSGTDEDELAIVNEVHNVDRIMGAHSNSVLTLIAIAAGAFVTTLKTEGGPGAPLIFATSVALATAGGIAAIGLALEGGVTAAAALPTHDLRERVDRNLRRTHRRIQLVRSATWCTFPAILLVVVCGVVVRT
ncbi:MAG: hypothetical protein ACRDPJ_09420 [Nocardioidaceae bacterium]